MTTDWANLYKVRLASSEPSMQKHETVKLLLVMKLLYKNRKKRNWIRIYTEQELSNNKICDVYYENAKEKSIIMYEIQKNISKEWLEETKKEYENMNDLFMNTDWMVIPLRKCPDNLEEIDKWLDQYVV